MRAPALFGFLRRCRAAAAVGGRDFGGRASVFFWVVVFLVACAGSGASRFFLRGRFFLAGAFLRPGGEVGSILGFFWEEFPEDASGLYHGNPRACPFAKGRRR